MRLIDADFLKEDLTRFYDGEVTARQLIDKQPTVETEQKKGRWVTVGERYVKCSECGLETTKNELRGIALFGENEPYFCPNCGADMRKENES